MVTSVIHVTIRCETEYMAFIRNTNLYEVVLRLCNKIYVELSQIYFKDLTIEVENTERDWTYCLNKSHVSHKPFVHLRANNIQHVLKVQNCKRVF